MKNLLTTKETAEIVGVTTGRIRQLILAKVLPAEKFGRDLFIKREDLKCLENRRPGNPGKRRRKV